MSAKPYYITTAIAYPNGPPHIGHAYEAIATDAIARFMRLDGYDVFFLTGTDEHGIKMLQTAAKQNLTPQELVARNVPRFQAMVKRLNCSNDAFIRTTEPRHYRSSEAIWKRMEVAGDIYLDRYAGWYSVRDEAYYDEDETRLDDKGHRLGPQGTPVEWVEEESYFFRLSAFAERLLKLYSDQPDFVLPKERLNEVASFVRGGLKDLSISRTTFDWGVPVPGDPKHVMYVWVDALTNYITAVRYPDTKSEKFRKFWPANLHVIGKDIVRFHAVYWPAFLMSAGIAVPRRIFSHGFLFNRGEKMSKSVGNVIDPFALVDAYGVDQFRYFVLREVPFGQDGNYNHEAIVARTNADLANDLGNLAQRSLTMVARNFGGELPKPGAFSAADQAILGAADGLIGKARDVMATQQLHQVLNATWAVVAEANRYFAGEAPWALAKTDPQRQGTVLYVTAEVLRQVAILALPFMPESAAKLLDLLAVPESERTFAFLGGKYRIASGAKLPAPAPVFPRYVEPEGKANISHERSVEGEEHVNDPGLPHVKGQKQKKDEDTPEITPPQAKTPDYRNLEILVAKIQRQLAPQADVLHNVRLDGRLSGTKRQIDVLVKENIGQYEIKIIIDCKDHKVPVDVKGVEEFEGLLRDVGAQKGVLVSPRGFTEAAKKRAEGFLIDLYSPIDTDIHKWRARVTIPALCDFRSAAMSFTFSMSAPCPFRMPMNFYSEAMVFDEKGGELGPALDTAMKNWNEGKYPSEAGDHKDLRIFDARTIFMDNGCEPPLRMRIPVDLTVSLLVKRQLYYGQLPVPQISGFYDQLSGRIITNAFTVGILDPEEVEKDWQKIDEEAEAPVQPTIRLVGLVGWYDE
jgi:methionyl-tRNA synthetase